jgi:mycofactocin system glycosyltransferase
VELPADWLAPLLPHFADPRVGLVAPRVVAAPDASTSSVLGRYEQTHGSLDMGPEAARVRAGTRVSYVPTAAVVCRTDAVRAVGGFDDALRFGEDVDLVWRLDGAGWRCRYEPAAVVGHRPRPIWRAWLRQRIDYGSSAAPLARRHPGALAPLRMSPWSIGCWLLVLAGRPALGGAIGIGSAAALVPRLPTLPAPAAFRLAALGNLRAGRQIAHATRRTWLPLVAVAALRSRLARRTLLASLVCVGHPIEVVDDVAYGVGVWKGMIEHRTIDPIIPEVRSWPGRSSSRRAASDGP